jgi:hypothetical protein
VAACLLAGAVPATAAGGTVPRFDEVADEAGIRHRHEKPVLDAKLDNVMPWVSSVGAAAAAADYDRDGRVDLFVTNSAKGAPNLLYRNDGGGTFAEVGERAGLARWNDDGGVAMHAVWGDVDSAGAATCSSGTAATAPSRT